MKYREALNIGYEADGTIKCTFATLYDENGKNLFSIQRKDAVRGMVYTGDASNAEAVLSSGLAMCNTIDLQSGVWVESNRYSESDGFSISVDIPLVTITGEPSTERLVPCKLIPGAIELLQNKLKNTKKVTMWKIIYRETGVLYRITYSYQEAEKWKAREDKFKVIPEYVLNPNYQKLIELLSNQGTFYIKPAAFDWQVLELKEEAEITYIDENGNEQTAVYSPENLKRLKDAYEKAKAILLGSTATLAI